MANLTIVVPNPMVADLTTMATAELTARGISVAGLTNTQIGQRFLAEIIKDRYIAWKRQQASDSAQAAIDAAHATATQTVTAAAATATSDAAGITG